MTQGHPYLLIQDDDSQEPASFWHIRQQEQLDVITALTIALQQPKLKFNKPLQNRLTYLLNQFRNGLLSLQTQALEATVSAP